MWMAETDEWNKQREAEIKDEADMKRFIPGWLLYDSNHDWAVTWEEVRYVRDVYEDEGASEEFWKHFKNTEDVVAGETMHVDEAFRVW
jgi:hypothetical protein